MAILVHNTLVISLYSPLINILLHDHLPMEITILLTHLNEYIYILQMHYLYHPYIVYQIVLHLLIMVNYLILDNFVTLLLLYHIMMFIHDDMLNVRLHNLIIVRLLFMFLNYV